MHEQLFQEIGYTLRNSDFFNNIAPFQTSVTPRIDRLSCGKADLRIRWASVGCEAEYLEFRREFGPIGTFAGKVRKCRWAPSDGTFGSIVTITIASLRRSSRIYLPKLNSQDAITLPDFI